ncbi:MAG: hypothetical protein ABW185_05135 [Sedimenticola sp.]
MNDLVSPTLDLLRSRNYKQCDILAVKIAAGINDLIKSVRHDGGRQLTLSGVTEKKVFEKLQNFKSEIKSVCPNALVGFATIPSLSFKDNNRHKRDNGELVESLFTEAEIEEQQRKINADICDINKRIKLENSTRQQNHERGCLTVSLHSEIEKKSRRRNRGGKLREVTQYKFAKLYDGLHGKSDLKHKWYNSLLKAIAQEIKYTIRDRASNIIVRV